MTDEAAAELYEHRSDPGEWEDEAEDIEVRPTGSEVVSFRLPSDQLTDLEQAAHSADESISEYVRTALAIRIHGKPVGPVVAVSHQGGSVFLVQSHFVTAGKTEGQESEHPWVPDEAPPLASMT